MCFNEFERSCQRQTCKWYCDIYRIWIRIVRSNGCSGVVMEKCSGRTWIPHMFRQNMWGIRNILGFERDGA